jgi:uncharacterized protein
MDKDMRRQDRAISDDEAVSILKSGRYGVLSTASPDDVPYGVPIGYCHVNGVVYFHCALAGRKLDNLRRNDRVSFCVVGGTEVLADKFTMNYESVIVSGRATEVSGDEKRAGLLELLRKYSPAHLESGLKVMEKTGYQTRVFKIVIEQMSGKARR